MATIDRFTTRTQAELARGLLAAHGFDAIVLSDDAGGTRPDISYGIGGTVVVVPDHQLAEALALLDAVHEGPLGDDEAFGGDGSFGDDLP
jgi:hypothetical protein